MSINLDNIPIFTEAINQQLQTKLGTIPPPSIAIDLIVTVSDLHVSSGRDLFEDLLSLEPYGMGNPVPKLLIKNCQFKDIKNRNIQDFKGKTVQYIRTKFELVDATSPKGFPGIWWGHYEHEIPRVNCDAIVELDFNSYDKRFEIRLVEVRPAAIDTKSPNFSDRQFALKILDFRQESVEPAAINSEPIIWVKQCPGDWDELQCYCQQAIQTSSKLALNYQSTNLATTSEILQQLIGTAKYVIQTGESVNLYRLRSRLNISDRAIRLGLDALVEIGFGVSLQTQTNLVNITLSQPLERPDTDLYSLVTVREFFAAIEEEQFKRNYFLHVPIYAIESSLSQ